MNKIINDIIALRFKNIKYQEIMTPSTTTPFKIFYIKAGEEKSKSYQAYLGAKGIEVNDELLVSYDSFDQCNLCYSI